MVDRYSIASPKVKSSAHRASLEEEVDRKDVVHPVHTALAIDELIQVADLRPDRCVWTASVAETDKGSVLIQTGIGAPIRVIEREENLVPHNERPFRTTIQDPLPAS